MAPPHTPDAWRRRARDRYVTFRERAATVAFGLAHAVAARARRAVRRVAGPAPAEGLKALAALPAEYDPRGPKGDRLTTPPRDQGTTEACGAFATVAAMETWLRRRRDVVDHLSERDLFERAGRVRHPADALEAATGRPSKRKGYEGTFGAVEAACAPAAGTGRCAKWPAHTWTLRYHRLNVLGGDALHHAMREALAGDLPLVVVAYFYPSFDAETGPDLLRPKPGEKWTLHALCVVGYGRDPSGGFWVVRNSYGPKWRDGGFARVRWGDRDLGIEEVVYVVDEVVPPKP